MIQECCFLAYWGERSCEMKNTVTLDVLDSGDYGDFIKIPNIKLSKKPSSKELLEIVIENILNENNNM